jgi:hypothetical protein
MHVRLSIIRGKKNFHMFRSEHELERHVHQSSLYQKFIEYYYGVLHTTGFSFFDQNEFLD